jgi:hypothetical protein
MKDLVAGTAKSSAKAIGRRRKEQNAVKIAMPMMP